MPAMPSEKTRKWIYRIGSAVIALLVAYGLLSEAEAAEWAILLAAILGVGESSLAAANTPQRDRR